MDGSECRTIDLTARAWGRVLKDLLPGDGQSETQGEQESNTVFNWKRQITAEVVRKCHFEGA